MAQGRNQRNSQNSHESQNSQHKNHSMWEKMISPTVDSETDTFVAVPRTQHNRQAQGLKGVEGRKPSNSTGIKASIQSNFIPYGTTSDEIHVTDMAIALVTNGSDIKDVRVKKKADYSGIRAVFNPIYCFYVLIASVALLTLIGIIMVFSSSTVTNTASGLSLWKALGKQLIFAVVGLAAGFALMHLPTKWVHRFSFFLMLFAIGLQALTMTSLGVATNGNTGWIAVGSITVQPAELLKLALCIWMPRAVHVSYNAYKKTRQTLRDLVRTYAFPVGGFLVGLIAVLAGKDLGTASIIALIGAAALFVGGFPLRPFFAAIGIGVVAILAIFVSGNSNRLTRITATYGGCSADATNATCYQSIHGLYALGTGGLFGVGLGNSREKWNYLPEAHNDFIFAVLGEELGFVGCIAVILLFLVLAWSLINIALRHNDAYAQTVMMCVTVWIMVQAFVNISVVIGILPVIGLPLPFISSGGSSLICCLAAVGACIGMARGQKEIAAALSRA